MFSLASRYHDLPVATFPGAGGDPVRYVTRRFLPPVDGLTVLAVHVVSAADRLDRIAALRLGDPELFWRIVDANPVLHPGELTERPGRALLVALPTAVVGSPRGF
ncbi:MAG TPA: LysM domain-containing protein [Kineosporiaceae bacterium]